MQRLTCLCVSIASVLAIVCCAGCARDQFARTSEAAPPEPHRGNYYIDGYVARDGRQEIPTGGITLRQALIATGAERKAVKLVVQLDRQDAPGTYRRVARVFFEPLLLEGEGDIALADQDIVLVVEPPGSQELFDLQGRRAELERKGNQFHNLGSDHPRVTELQAALRTLDERIETIRRQIETDSYAPATQPLEPLPPEGLF